LLDAKGLKLCKVGDARCNRRPACAKGSGGAKGDLHRLRQRDKAAQANICAPRARFADRQIDVFQADQGPAIAAALGSWIADAAPRFRASGLMCRWIAYRGKTIPLSHYVTEPSHSLVSQSLQALESTASTNGDGFGLGWYDHLPEPGLYREIRPAWSDENLRYLCRHLQSRLFFAHVRAATGTPVSRPNCHPFACRGWLFMHNGFIGGWSRLRRRIEMLVPNELYPARIGTTDSEALFLAILGAGTDDPLAATAWVVHEVARMVDEQGEPFRFTAALTNGRDVYAFRYAINDAANTLYYRENDGEFLAVSEPIDRDHSRWIAVPDNSYVVAKAGGHAALRHFPLRHRDAAE
jgi:predicted glutamine amidotransferase